MKKIIFVTPNLANGGAEYVTSVLANEMAKRGDTVEVAYMKDEETVYRLCEKIDTCFLFSGKNRFVRILLKIIRLRKKMKENRDAVFIAMLPFETLYTHAAGIGIRPRVVYSLRNDPANMNSLVDKYIKKFVYGKADRIVFQTEEARDYFPEAVRKKGTVIPNPLSDHLPERFTGQRKKEIAAVGRLAEQKNYPLLLRSFANVHKIHPEWKLRIYGKGGLEQELRELCAELGISRAAEFCGFVPDAAERINQSGMFVMSSDYEGLSNAMLDALATGVPCICTDCPAGGARMMIRDHINGILVPPGDERKMTEAMLELIESPETADVISRKAVEIRDILSAEKITEKWRRLL